MTCEVWPSAGVLFLGHNRLNLTNHIEILSVTSPKLLGKVKENCLLLIRIFNFYYSWDYYQFFLHHWCMWQPIINVLIIILLLPKYDDTIISFIKYTIFSLEYVIFLHMRIQILNANWTVGLLGIIGQIFHMKIKIWFCVVFNEKTKCKHRGMELGPCFSAMG